VAANETEAKRVLIADDELNMRRVLEAILRREGYDVVTAANGNEALANMGRGINMVITDLKMPGLDGMGLLRKLSVDYPDVPVVMITAHGSVENAVEAVKLGAFDYLEKPFEQEQIHQIVAKAMRTHSWRVAMPGPRSRSATGGSAWSASRPRSARSTPWSRRWPTPLDGAHHRRVGHRQGAHRAGAAREFFAARTGPFIKINCAAIPKTLMESELFGYEKGAFTGAVGSKPGRFELAHGGTLFLDEIGEIPVEMQVKLLRVLQESEFERVGGIKTIKVDVRLLTATNRDLAAGDRRGGFRDDLFYRLNVVPIHLPALRERRQDIPMLVDHFIARFNERLKKQITGADPEAVERLVAHNWPGNIRELENVIERTILFCEGPRIQLEDLPRRIRRRDRVVIAARSPGGGGRGANAPWASPAPSAAPPVGEEVGSLKEAVRVETERVERDLIQRALDETGGNVTQAARKLQISRKSLQTKMKELGLRDRE
jgi:two-component system response regulator AtoC